MWTTPPCLLHSSMTSSWISMAQLGSFSLEKIECVRFGAIRSCEHFCLYGCEYFSVFNHNQFITYDCGLKRLESWRQCVASGCAGRFRAWLGAGVGIAEREKVTSCFLEELKKGVKNDLNQDSPGGPPMFGKAMEPVIWRACWAAGGIFSPVPVERETNFI